MIYEANDHDRDNDHGDGPSMELECVPYGSGRYCGSPDVRRAQVYVAIDILACELLAVSKISRVFDLVERCPRRRLDNE
jgi:hypothetical protein